MDDQPRALPVSAQRWTRIDDYVVGLARRRTARRAFQPAIRTEPENPRFWLGNLPFALLFAALVVMAVGTFVAAWPGHRSAAQSDDRPAAKELGVAPRGWLQKAEKEFH
jgi:hypothetical protein